MENGVKSRIKDEVLTCDEFVRETFEEARANFLRRGYVGSE